MLTYLKNLFFGGRDDERRHETSANDAARMLEMSEPMSAAGAQLAGDNNTGETEESLRRAAEQSEPKKP